MDTEAAVDTAVNVVETVAEHAEAVEIIVKNNPVVVAGVLAGGLIIGGLISHFATKKYLNVKYEILLEEELEKTQRIYAERLRESKKRNNETIVVEEKPLKKAEFIAEKAGYKSYHTISNPDTSATENKTPVIEKFDYEEEERKRQNHEPYIIDDQTFMSNDEEQEQYVLTFYDEDEVLCDEDEEAIRSTVEIIGEGNLKFGYGSNDDKTVYIRNERLGTDYEVILAEGSYVKLVLGMHEEDTPSSNQKSR